jgi:hypothetical protein
MVIGKDISGDNFLTRLVYPGGLGDYFRIIAISINTFWRQMKNHLSLLINVSERFD